MADTLNKKMATLTRELVKLRTKKQKSGRETYFLDYKVNGERVKKYLPLYKQPGTSKEVKEANKTSLNLAKTAQQKVLSDIINGKLEINTKSEDAKSISLVAYIEEVAERKKVSGQSVSNTTGILSMRDHVKTYIGNKKVMLSDVDKDFLLGFINYLAKKAVSKSYKTPKPLAKKSAEQYYNYLVTCLKEAERDEYIKNSPHRKIRQSDKKPIIGKSLRKREPLTNEELAKLVNSETKNPEIRLAFLFAVFCGLRNSDIHSLKWGEIKEGDGILYIDKVQQKTQEELVQPLGVNAMKFLPPRGEDDALVFPNLPNACNTSRHVERWCERVLGKDRYVVFHTARHTFATNLYAATEDIYMTKEFLGHKNLKSTMVYAKTQDKTKVKAIGKLDASIKI